MMIDDDDVIHNKPAMIAIAKQQSCSFSILTQPINNRWLGPVRNTSNCRSKNSNNYIQVRNLSKGVVGKCSWNK
jgi:hypothetical protein